MKILAVDDDPLFLGILEASLNLEGYKDISCVESGADALQVIDLPAVMFDCVLLDVEMPEMGGIELCRRIRAVPGYDQVPILMITATAKRETIDAAFAAGATDYLNKPIEPVELIARIRVAQKIIQKEFEKSKNAHTASIYREHVEEVLGFAIYDPITISGVPNCLSKAEFENYLLRLGRFRMFQSCVTALAIPEFVDIYGKTDPAELHEILADVADTISDNLSSIRLAFTYVGGGEFVCVSERGNAAIFENIAPHIQAGINDLDLTYVDGSPLKLTILVGEPTMPTLWTAGKPTYIENAALASIDDKRKSWRAETAAARRKPPKASMVAE